MAKIKMSDSAKEARKYFYKVYEEKKKRPYNASFAKDGMLFQHICSRYPIEWVLGMIDFYLTWDDSFVKQTGYTIGVFYSKINQMLEYNIHKSQWVKNHEKGKLKSSADILGGLGYGKKKEDV